MVSIDVSSNIAQVQQSIQRMQRQIPFAQSLAAKKAVEVGRREVLRQAQIGLDNPIPALLNERRGWVFIEWDNKQVAKQQGFANGKVYIRGKGSDPKELAAQQEIAHRNIYGTTERNTPISVPYIIKPSKYLRRGARIRNVPLTIDQYGNIKGRGNRSYVDTVTDMVTNPKYKGQFFEVKIGETVRQGNMVLQPGLYQRLLFKKRRSDYVKHPVTGKRRGPYRPTNQPKYTAKFLLTILQFYPLRDYKAQWKFKPPAIAKMRETYGPEFIAQLNRLYLDQPSRRRPANATGQS